MTWIEGGRLLYLFLIIVFLFVSFAASETSVFQGLGISLVASVLACNQCTELLI